jgi:lysophospholipase L1-like esterase
MSKVSNTGSVLRWLLVLAGAVVLAAVISQRSAGRPAGLVDYGGEVSVREDGALVMGADSWVTLGEGRRVDVSLPQLGPSLDLLLGDMSKLYNICRVGPVQDLKDAAGATHHTWKMEVLDQRGEPMGQGYLARDLGGRPGSVGLNCGPPLMLYHDNKQVEHAEPRIPCKARPVGIYAREPLVVSEAWVDGQAVSLGRTGPDLKAGGVALGVALLSALLLGPAAFPMLLLAPAAGWFARFGLPADSVLWTLYAAAASGALMEGRAWRRALAGLACFGAMGMAVRAYLDTIEPIGTVAEDADNASVAAALQVGAGIGAYLWKVRLAVDYYRPWMKKVDPDKPLVVTLGSSSTGGNNPEGFWPGVLAEEVPEVHVQTLAWGGGTSWHMRKIMDRLDVEADYCFFYMGHNDTLPSMPRQSLASLERGEESASDAFVSPVTLAEAEENLRAMAQRCGTFVAMQEYSVGREAELAEYAAMMASIPELEIIDLATTLSGYPYAKVMADPVHPSFFGQRLMGEQVAAWLREDIARGGAP